MKNFFRSLLPWPKPPASPAPEAEKPSWHAGMMEVFDAYPIGGEFTYCGRRLIVIRHRAYIGGFYGHTIHIQPIFPAIITQYADDHGKIHRLEFDLVLFPLLRSLQARR